jgi:signal transduction histidine kinase
VLSHELNNTLAPIASLAQSGADMAHRRQTPELSEVFNTIGERAEHLHQFITGYAQLAKLPTPRLEPVEWRDLIGEVVAQQACRVTGPLPPKPGYFDRAQIAQALINLIKNAHEAGGPAESVELAIDQNGAEHRIRVSDRGPGMRANVMSQALLPFYSTKRSGTGLGLALVREIAEGHGGHIQLSNREGGGLCAILTLPATPTTPAQPLAAPEQTSR